MARITVEWIAIVIAGCSFALSGVVFLFGRKDKHDEKIKAIEQCLLAIKLEVAVLRERTNNEIEVVNKLDDKLDKINDILRDH